MALGSFDVGLQTLESEVNELLESVCGELMADAERVEYYAGLFDRTMESGFYSGRGGPKGAGEQPTWAPNPAYMDSLEELWKPVDEALARHGLVLEKSLRDLFYESREYKDQRLDHRRVFHGQLMDKKNGVAVTYFMMSIPHSHETFRYLMPPRIQISPTL